MPVACMATHVNQEGRLSFLVLPRDVTQSAVMPQYAVCRRMRELFLDCIIIIIIIAKS